MSQSRPNASELPLPPKNNGLQIPKNRSFLNPDTVHKPHGYTHLSAVRDPGRIIFISGQVGTDPSGNTDPKYEVQVAQAFRNLKACIEAAGASPSDVTKVSYYVVDYEPGKLAALGKEQAALFGQHHPPPSTLVPVPVLAAPDLLFEVDATVVVNAQQQEEDAYDVIIVGGGLSGLQTAVSLQAAGHSCLVLEAMDRVGGKTLSVESGGTGYNDLGAAWINDTNQSEMYKLFQKYGLGVLIQRDTGNDLLKRYEGTVESVPFEGSGVESVDSTAIGKVIEDVKRLCGQMDLERPEASPGASKLDALTWETYCAGVASQAEDEARDFATTLSAALLGVHGDEVSALYMIHYIASGTGFDNMVSDGKDGGQYLRCRQGMQSVSVNLSKSLRPGTIRLSSPVAGIVQSLGGHCTVTTVGGQTFSSQKVVVTVPTTLYNTITFSPPLPTTKQSLVDSAVMGYYTKVIYAWDQPWWQKAGLSGRFSASEGPITLTKDTSSEEDGQFSISCFIVGQRGRDCSKLPRSVRQEQVWDQFCEFFEPVVGTVPVPIKVLEQEWNKQGYFLGAPCPVMVPGAMTKFGPALRAPFGNIHFAGTETSLVWKGYMEGAVRSGQRVADEVDKALASSEPEDAARVSRL